MLRVSEKSAEEGSGIGEVSEDSNVVVDQKGIYGYDQEILDREAADAPFRRLRLIAYGLFALAALILGIISLAGLAGVKEAKGISENLPNPLLDAGVLALAYYLWVEEASTTVKGTKVWTSLQYATIESHPPGRVRSRPVKRYACTNPSRHTHWVTCPALANRKMGPVYAMLSSKRKKGKLADVPCSSIGSGQSCDAHASYPHECTVFDAMSWRRHPGFRLSPTITHRDGRSRTYSTYAT